MLEYNDDYRKYYLERQPIFQHPFAKDKDVGMSPSNNDYTSPSYSTDDERRLGFPTGALDVDIPPAPIEPQASDPTPPPHGDRYDNLMNILKRISGEKRFLLQARDKSPFYPSKDWQERDNELTPEQVIDAYRAHGEEVRGPAIVPHDEFLILDEDPLKPENIVAAEKRGITKEQVSSIREQIMNLAQTSTYCEKSERGRHAIFRISKNFEGRNAIKILKEIYGIDMITGRRSCYVSGNWISRHAEPVDYTPELEALFDQIDAAHPDVARERSSVTTEWSVTALRELVSCLDPDCGRDQWVRVQMAVHNATVGSDEGFRIVDEWSSRGEKYLENKPGEMERMWRGFTPDGSISAGTLIMYAKEAGADIAAIHAMNRLGLESIQLARVLIDHGRQQYENIRRAEAGKAKAATDRRERYLKSSTALRSSAVPSLDEIFASEDATYTKEEITPRVVFEPPPYGPTRDLYEAVLSTMHYPNPTIAWVAMSVVRVFGTTGGVS